MLIPPIVHGVAGDAVNGGLTAEENGSVGGIVGATHRTNPS
jgi:hypothetical protein